MSEFDDIFSNTPAEQSGGQLSKEDFAAKKREEREAVFSLADATAMEVAGGGDKFRQYLDVQSTFDRYSAVNTLLIMAQKPEATRLGDFDHWKNKGGVVKGKSEISIIEPHEYTKGDGTPGTGYNIKKVFDISQVDTRNMKPSAPPPKPSERQLLTALVKSSPVAIVGVENLPDDAGAVRHEERIDVRKGMGFDDTFRSLAMEIARADIDGREAQPQNADFSAYCASYILCQKYGADTKDFNFDSAGYMFKDMDAQAVKGELGKIRDTADSVSGRMAQSLEAAQKAAKNNDAR